jgi:outer membrane lipoprotein-sorting protein
MNVPRIAAAFALALSFARADSLEDVLKRMDDAASQFKSVSATLAYKDYQKRWDESDEKNGTVHMRLTNKGPEGVWSFTGKDAQVVSLSGHEARVYKPKAKLQQIYDAGKNVAVMQETLLLGFGSRSAELRKSFDIVLGGPDTVAGKPCTRIQLTPKKKEVLEFYTKIDLWIPDGESNPVQEKIWIGVKGDYKLATYSDVKINPPLPDSTFQFKPPAGTQIVKAN